MKTCVPIALLFVLATSGAFAEHRAAHRPWSDAELRLFATLPIQDGGRVKPLDTYAGFKLLEFNGRRKCPTPGGKRLSPLEWLLDCLLYPETAADYQVFSINDSGVIVNLGLTPHNATRSRYSYRELSPGRDKLSELADLYARMPARSRSTVQTQLLHLAGNVTEYEAITGYAQFARRPFVLGTSETLSALFPQGQELCLSAILDTAPDLHEKYLALRRESEQGDRAPARELEAFSKLFEDLDSVRETAHALALFPSGSPGQEDWLTPADMVVRAFDDRLADVELDSLAAFERLVQSLDDPGRFQENLASFHARARALAEARGEYGKIELEVVYYKAKLLYRALILYIVCFVLVAFSWLAPGSRALNRAAPLALLFPTALLVAGITLRCVIRGRPPVTTLYETILFVTAVVVVLSLAFEYFDRQRIALAVGSVLAVLGMFLANKYEAREGVDTMPSMVAVLDTNFWLSIHVTTIAIG